MYQRFGYDVHVVHAELSLIAHTLLRTAGMSKQDHARRAWDLSFEIYAVRGTDTFIR